MQICLQLKWQFAVLIPIKTKNHFCNTFFKNFSYTRHYTGNPHPAGVAGRGGVVGINCQLGNWGGGFLWGKRVNALNDSETDLLSCSFESTYSMVIPAVEY